MNSKDRASCYGNLLYLFVIGPIATIWRGYVITLLWRWFLCPFGIKPISIAHAIGLSIIFTMDVYQHRKMQKDELTEGKYLSFILPAMLLFFGWIAHLFM